MSPDDSVSEWLDHLQVRNPSAAKKLWDRYFRRLIGLVRHKLRASPRLAALYQEDVALSAFDSFCRGAEEGRFPDLVDRDNLWRLLVTITARKAYQLKLREGRSKRGGGAVLDEAALAALSDSGSGLAGLERLADGQPTPPEVAQLAEECQELLAALPSAELRAVALLKMDGYTNKEIATRLGCALRSVERRLQVIRSLLAQRDEAR